jgi:hypothetical protein
MAPNLNFQKPIFQKSNQIHLKIFKQSSRDYNQSTADPSMGAKFEFHKPSKRRPERPVKTAAKYQRGPVAGSNIDALTSLHNGLRHTSPASPSICRYNAPVADVSIDTRAPAEAARAFEIDSLLVIPVPWGRHAAPSTRRMMRRTVFFFNINQRI